MADCVECGANNADFYPGNRRCKECVCRAVRANRAANVAHYRQYDQSRNMRTDRVAARKEYLKTKAGKAARAKAMINHDVKFPIKRKATIAVNNAVRDGRLFKQPCETCGIEKVEAHHDDYSKPLEVRWVCNKHHREIHKGK